MKSLEDKFLPYGSVLALKELGYNDECFGFYQKQSFGFPKLQFVWSQVLSDKQGDKQVGVGYSMGGDMTGFVCKAPLYDQAREWLWENYKITIEPKINPQEKEDLWMIRAVDWSGGKLVKQFILDTDDVRSPIKAERDGIRTAIKYVYEKGYVNKAKIAVKDGQYFLEGIGKGFPNGVGKLLHTKEEVEKKYKEGDVVEFGEYVQFQGTMGEVFWDTIVGLI